MSDPNETTPVQAYHLQDAVDHDQATYNKIQDTIMLHRALFPNIASRIDSHEGGLWDLAIASEGFRMITLNTSDDQGKPVTAGFVVFSDFDHVPSSSTHAAPERELYSLAVYPEYQLRGFGTKLREAMDGREGTDNPKLTGVPQPATLTYHMRCVPPGSGFLDRWLTRGGFELQGRPLVDESLGEDDTLDVAVPRTYIKSTFESSAKEVRHACYSLAPATAIRCADMFSPLRQSRSRSDLSV
jgi:GNAT superfamily N-acetyltransferase